MASVTPSLREQYRSGKAALLQGLPREGSSTRGVRTTLQRLARHADDMLRQLWRAAGLGPEFALVAVGGHGRGELFPHSDVDVLLLLPDHADPGNDETLKSKLEQFIGNCWDTGLDIGSSVRTVPECVQEAERDITVQTALVECRLVCGNRAQFARLADALGKAIQPKAFFVAKTLEMRQRHQRQENTPYALEPNCKEAPGGLRDLQTILWVARAAGLGKSWDELGRRGLATALEVRQLKANEALLSLIRLRLHTLANRREDRLVFDLQTAVAESFGYHPQVQAPGHPDAGMAAGHARGARRVSATTGPPKRWPS
jgi:[protein-PII] uridylyltransferase